VQGAGCRVWGAGGVRGVVECWVWSRAAVIALCGLAFWVWGLEFGVEGLVFFVLGFGFLGFGFRV